MTKYYEPLPKPARGLTIGLLVLTILNWVWPFWNSVYGFFATTYFGFTPEVYYNGQPFENFPYTFIQAPNTSFYNKVAGLGLAFGLVTVFHGLFGFAKVSIFSMDLDHKISPQIRIKWIDAYLSECVSLHRGCVLPYHIMLNNRFIAPLQLQSLKQSSSSLPSSLDLLLLSSAVQVMAFMWVSCQTLYFKETYLSLFPLPHYSFFQVTYLVWIFMGITLLLQLISLPCESIEGQ